jgi:hypothetical protein
MFNTAWLYILYPEVPAYFEKTQTMNIRKIKILKFNQVMKAGLGVAFSTDYAA